MKFLKRLFKTTPEEKLKDIIVDLLNKNPKYYPPYYSKYSDQTFELGPYKISILRFDYGNIVYIKNKNEYSSIKAPYLFSILDETFYKRKKIDDDIEREKREEKNKSLLNRLIKLGKDF